ncbi:MAG: hypothetical protein JJT94_06055 [Bernardetiaceae bacterium]|nr:hypothetical protein [Bernardetiaceae bacterium]
MNLSNVKIIFALFLFCCYLPSYAQQVSFGKVSNTGNHEEFLEVVNLPNGEYVSASLNYKLNLAGDKSLVLRHYSENGELIKTNQEATPEIQSRTIHSLS